MKAFFKNHFSLALLQFPQDVAHTGGVTVVQPVAVVALVAVGTCGVAAELADGQFLAATATDKAGCLSLIFISSSHITHYEL